MKSFDVILWCIRLQEPVAKLGTVEVTGGASAIRAAWKKFPEISMRQVTVAQNWPVIKTPAARCAHRNGDCPKECPRMY